MFATARSPFSIIFRPILYLLGLSNKPQMNIDPALELPPDDGTPLPVPTWKDAAVKSYLNFPESRDYWVVQIKRYKKKSATQHEYMVATVEHPGKGKTWHLQIERGRENVRPDGIPVLTREQESLPPPSPGDDISTGQWAAWFEPVKGQQPIDPVPPPKVSGIDAILSSGSLAKVGRAYDIVKIWKTPSDTLIESLNLRPNPMRLVDLAILAYTVHENESLYNLFKHQCFWYANMIARVIAKKRNLPIGDSPDQEPCYDTVSGKFYMIPVHIARPKVVQALEKEFDRQLGPVQEQINKRLAQERQALKDKDRLVTQEVELEQLKKDKEAAEEKVRIMAAELRRFREPELAQGGQSSTQK